MLSIATKVRIDSSIVNNLEAIRNKYSKYVHIAISYRNNDYIIVFSDLSVIYHITVDRRSSSGKTSLRTVPILRQVLKNYISSPPKYIDMYTSDSSESTINYIVNDHA